MESRRSLSLRLFAGLVVTLTAIGVYFGYTIVQIRGLRQLQSEIIDRNRMDSLLLLRIQNNLNSLGLATRDMLDSAEPYPLTAWRSQFKRVRLDLEDAVAREGHYSPAGRTEDQGRYLANSMGQFWDALDRIFVLAETNEAEARTQIGQSLQSRLDALSTAVSRLLVQNNESEQQAALKIQEIYARVERNVYLFLTAMLIVVAITSAYIVQYNRRVFGQVADISQSRSELARQLISMQESTFRHISRELHDDFGQILTAIGAMLQRVNRHVAAGSPIRDDLQEVRELVQSTLEKVRTLSQALHPVMLEEVGFESALGNYLPAFEKRTGIAVHYEKHGVSRTIDGEIAIHLYRVLQEALNNIVRHSQSKTASVKLDMSPSSVTLEVEDEGVGFQQRSRRGMGLVSMRERAELVNGTVEFLANSHGGALVRMIVPLEPEEIHA